MGRNHLRVLYVAVLIGYIITMALVVSQTKTADAIPPTIYRPVEATVFVPVIVDPVVGESHRRRPHTPSTQAPVRQAIRQTQLGQTQPSGRHSITGKASWYCRAGISICHHAYPPGSMVAAACRKLRIAMGPGWRGDTVTVSSGGRTVTVKLVDWCGSTTKLIDLYWEPMRRLGGTGVIPVTVRWR